MLKDIVDNYVFQNAYKEYFNDNLYEIVGCINKDCDKEKYRTSSYSITGIFNNKERIIDFPNIFTYAYSAYKILNSNINDLGKLNVSRINTMNIDFKNRKFKSNSFTKNLDNKLNLLLNEYDFMYKIDIRNFYKSIYTHVFSKIRNQNGAIDAYIRLYNDNKTNCLLLGNILSTLCANEIMEDMSTDIKEQLEDIKIEYFSDQFYIFFNSNHKYDEILEAVKKVISKSYFEFEINEDDTKVYTHEELVKLRNFRKMQDNLYEKQNIEYDDAKFYIEYDFDYSSKKMIYYFNSLIDSYYNIDINKRRVFVEVALKRTFSFAVNLYRLKIILDNNDENSTRIVEILFMFLNKHPELILLYIKLGIWYIIENSNIYNNKELFYKYENKFYDKMVLYLNKLNGIYYFHIYYLLKNKFKSENKRNEFLNLYKNKMISKNYLLDSIIASTFNITPSIEEINNMKFNGEKWLYNYTLYFNSTNYNNSLDEIDKAVNNAKRKGIRIIKKLSDIEVPKKVINKLNDIKNKFEKNMCEELI